MCIYPCSCVPIWMIGEFPNIQPSQPANPLTTEEIETLRLRNSAALVYTPEVEKLIWENMKPVIK